MEAFNANTNVELHAGLQAIIQSNGRLEFTAGFPLLSKSYTRSYPCIPSAFSDIFIDSAAYGEDCVSFNVIAQKVPSQ